MKKILYYLLLISINLHCIVPAYAGHKFKTKSPFITIYRGNKFEHAGLDYLLQHSNELPAAILKRPFITNSGDTTTMFVGTLLLTMNDQKIYYYDQVTSPPQPYPGNEPIDQYVLNNFISEFNRLPDGSYDFYMHNIVIDTFGRVVYFTGCGIGYISPKQRGVYFHLGRPDHSKTGVQNKAGRKAMWRRLTDILNTMPPIQPAKLDGKPVISVIQDEFRSYRINVQNHNSSLSKL